MAFIFLKIAIFTISADRFEPVICESKTHHAANFMIAPQRTNYILVYQMLRLFIATITVSRGHKNIPRHKNVLLRWLG
jgi:hypothetical protein